MKTNGRFAILLCFFVLSCRFTDKDVTRPKTMFDGDLDRFRGAYDRIESGKTTWGELVQNGFRFDDSNLLIFVGAKAIKFIFGEEVFQGAARTEEQLQGLLGLDRYRAVIIPHKDLTVKRDRIYFTHKETFSWGHDARFVILFRDGVVVYHTADIENIDRYQLAKAWGQGVLEFIGLAREATNLPNPKPPDALKRN